MPIESIRSNAFKHVYVLSMADIEPMLSSSLYALLDWHLGESVDQLIAMGQSNLIIDDIYAGCKLPGGFDQY